MDSARGRPTFAAVTLTSSSTRCAGTRHIITPMTRRSPLAVIFFTVFLDLLGFGILLPFTAFYIRAYGGPHMTPAQVATANTWLGTAYSLMQFLFPPLCRRLPDPGGPPPTTLI